MDDFFSLAVFILPANKPAHLAGFDGLEPTMDFIFAGVTAVLVLIYLTYVMFNPEKF